MNEKCVIDPTVFRLLRLVIYADSKQFDEELEDVRWAKGEDKFFKEIGKFMKENYGDKKKDMKSVFKEFKKIKKDLSLWKTLSFTQIIRKDYKEIAPKVGFAILQATQQNIFGNLTDFKCKTQYLMG